MFSVIIPLFNKELSINDTIQSVLSQSYQKFELVIVNDGSTDNGAQLVQEINDPRIRMVNQPNRGVSAARNRGIEEAQFDWIAFLDGDDLWQEQHLEELLKMISAFPNEKVFATSFIYSTGEPMVGNTNKGAVYKIQNFFMEYLNTKNLVWTSIVAVNKSCFDIVDKFNTKFSLGEDMDLWGRLSKKYTIVKSNKITATYRRDAENRSNSGRYSMKKSFLSALNFNKMESREERNFYKFWIIHKMKFFVRTNDYVNLLFLTRKYGFSLLFK